MVCPSAQLFDLLQARLTRWDEDLQQIKEPGASLIEELALIHERSKRRIEEFARNPLQDNAAVLQQALISDGRQIERLELEHKENMAQQQELQNKEAQVVAGKILKDLVDILSLPTAKKLAPELWSPDQEQQLDPHLGLHNDAPSGIRRPVGSNADISLARTGYTRRSRRLCQRASPPAHQPVNTENSSTQKRKPDTGVEDERQTKVHRTGGMKTPPPKTVNSGSYSNNNDKAPAAAIKRGMTLQCRTIAFGGNKTARVTLQRQPSQGLWVCTVQFPKGQNTPQINNIMGRSIIPGFLRLANQDHEQVVGNLECQQPTQQATRASSEKTTSENQSDLRGSGESDKSDDGDKGF
ncbi:hypothetical protein FGLOB1_3277 [Fusarium globosum]|uniref:Uncharacterized protein n=1 Tax=Fusarium globosum TaxID=78864 RepID=A0A8H6DFI7_9HYPO|nr:hypothetical protein FGLOB1_3277 [Fusarium globosum]